MNNLRKVENKQSKKQLTTLSHSGDFISKLSNSRYYLQILTPLIYNKF